MLSVTTCLDWEKPTVCQQTSFFWIQTLYKFVSFDPEVFKKIQLLKGAANKNYSLITEPPP